MTESANPWRLGRKWVPAVLAIGAAVGFGLSLVPSPSGGSLGRNLHVFLSAIIVALLVVLFAVYLKVYRDTRARFALGLLVVLGLFLFQAVLIFPLLLGAFGERLEGGERFLPIGDALFVIAFSIFLYLSLE